MLKGLWSFGTTTRGVTKSSIVFGRRAAVNNNNNSIANITTSTSTSWNAASPQGCYYQHQSRLTGVVVNSVRWNSSSDDSDDAPPHGFRPRRSPSKHYRVKPKTNSNNNTTAPEQQQQPQDHFEFQEEVRQTRRDRARGRAPDAEYQLRMIDYLTADFGSTEEKMLERRLLAESFDTPAESQAFMDELDRDVERLAAEEAVEVLNDDVGEDDDEYSSNDKSTKNRTKFELSKEEEEDDDNHHDPLDPDDDPRCQIPTSRENQDWGETMIRMDRVQKVQRGGTLLRYRCLVVGGNARGVAGFGIGKATEPKEAAEAASRMCRRNIFFIDAYQSSGLTTDLVGKHNSCLVRIRAQPAYRGLRGHALVCEILLFFGITDCTAKTHGNRNIYNVVYATFKAIMKHRSMEDISRARGKRYLTLDKARRLDMMYK